MEFLNEGNISNVVRCVDDTSYGICMYFEPPPTGETVTFKDTDCFTTTVGKSIKISPNDIVNLTGSCGNYITLSYSALTQQFLLNQFSYENNCLIFTPPDGYFGNITIVVTGFDCFNKAIVDSNSNPAITIQICVNAVSNNIRAVIDTNECGLTNYDIFSEGSPCPITILSAETTPNGVIDIISGSVINYTPSSGFTGIDEHSLQISGDCVSNLINLTLVFNVENVGILGVNDYYRIYQSNALQLNILENDIFCCDINDVTLEIFEDALFGSVTVNSNNTITYLTTDPCFLGNDNLTYSIECNGQISYAQVCIEVICAPILSESFSTDALYCEDTIIDIITLSNTELCCPKGQFVFTVKPSYGIIKENNCGILTYYPNNCNLGDDVIKGHIIDVNGCKSNEITITINILANPLDCNYVTNEDVNFYDCAGIYGGTYVIDDCGNCVPEINFNYAMDCAGICSGTSFVDACGECVSCSTISIVKESYDFLIEIVDSSLNNFIIKINSPITLNGVWEYSPDPLLQNWFPFTNNQIIQNGVEFEILNIANNTNFSMRFTVGDIEITATFVTSNNMATLINSFNNLCLSSYAGESDVCYDTYTWSIDNITSGANASILITENDRVIISEDGVCDRDDMVYDLSCFSGVTIDANLNLTVELLNNPIGATCVVSATTALEGCCVCPCSGISLTVDTFCLDLDNFYITVDVDNYPTNTLFDVYINDILFEQNTELNNAIFSAWTYNTILDIIVILSDDQTCLVQQNDIIYSGCAPSEIIVTMPESPYNAGNCGDDDIYTNYITWIQHLDIDGNSCNATANIDLDGAITWVTSAITYTNKNQILDGLDNDYTLDICGGVITLTVDVDDSCGTSEIYVSELTIDSPTNNLIEITCSDDITISSCLTQDEVNTAFYIWRNGFSYIGACNVSDNKNNFLPPQRCGGSTVLNYIAADACDNSETCTATFTVEFPLILLATGPSDEVVPPCRTQSEVNALFNAWINIFSHNGGGCDVVETNLSIYSPPTPQNSAVTVNYYVSGSCGSSADWTATFTAEHILGEELNVCYSLDDNRCDGDIGIYICNDYLINTLHCFNFTADTVDIYYHDTIIATDIDPSKQIYFIGCIDEPPVLDLIIVNNGDPYDAENILAQTPIFDECTFTELNIKVLLEGRYNSGDMTNSSANWLAILPSDQPYSGSPWNYMGVENISPIPPQMVDWVLVEAQLISGSSRCKVEIRAGILLSNGDIVDSVTLEPLLFKNLIYDEEYHLVIRHRNHIDVISSPITAATSVIYDFSTQTPSGIFNKQKDMLDGYFSMYAGDANGDNIIDIVDYNLWLIDNATLFQYLGADFNLSAIVNNLDYNLWNNNNGISNTSTYENCP